MLAGYGIPSTNKQCKYFLFYNCYKAHAFFFAFAFFYYASLCLVIFPFYYSKRLRWEVFNFVSLVLLFFFFLHFLLCFTYKLATIETLFGNSIFLPGFSFTGHMAVGEGREPSLIFLRQFHWLTNYQTFAALHSTSLPHVFNRIVCNCLK